MGGTNGIEAEGAGRRTYMYNRKGNMYGLQTKPEAYMTLGKRQRREFGNKFPPTLPVSGSHFGVENLETNFACHCPGLISLCLASLSRRRFVYHYRLWFNRRIF